MTPPSAARAEAVRGFELIPHADDCGLSPGITDAILDCYDRGWLRRTSVVVNGAGWEHAVEALRKRPGLSVALHVNLFEGASLSEPKDVCLLVDPNGRFHRTFAWLWRHGTAGPRARELRAQIRVELARQIERFLDAFGDRGPLMIDGHVHYHVLPAVAGELLALAGEYPVRAMRLPYEPLYWRPLCGASRPPLVNLVKNVTLRTLCRRLAPALRARSISTPSALIGVLGTGAMTLGHVRAALEHLRRNGAAGTVEILFHPGAARPSEAPLWSDRPELQAFYLSPRRRYEGDLLRSAAFGELLRAYGTADVRTAAPPERALEVLN